jgi:calcium-dependent protein kinase
MSKDKSLDLNEYLFFKNIFYIYTWRLSKFLLRVDPNLTREEIEYLFNKFDEDSSNSIDF